MQQEQSTVCFICMDSEGSAQIYWHRDANGNKCNYKHPICYDCLHQIGGECPICRTQFDLQLYQSQDFEILRSLFEVWDLIVTKIYPIHPKGIRYIHEWTYGSNYRHGHIPVEMYEDQDSPIIIKDNWSDCGKIFTWLMLYSKDSSNIPTIDASCSVSRAESKRVRMTRHDVERLINIDNAVQDDGQLQLKHIILKFIIRFLQNSRFMLRVMIPADVVYMFENEDQFRNAQMNEVYVNILNIHDSI